MYRIGLTLSGGGAKGLAHAGVLKALEEYGLRPQIISGVSAGAIVAALYADGKSPDDICYFFKQTKFMDYVGFSTPKKGLMSTRKFEKMIGEALSAKTFEELKIPIYINATELTVGENAVFSSGPLVEKIVASASVPIVLTPKEIGDKVYVDGGIFNNMPASLIRSQCKFLIGCHVNPIRHDTTVHTAKQILERIYNLSIQSSTVPEKKICNLVLEPDQAKQYGMFDTDHFEDIFNIGYEYTKQILLNTKIELPL